MSSIMAAGALLYGALSLIGIFAMALTVNDHTAAVLAIASAGFAYVSQLGSMQATTGATTVSLGAMAASIILGIAGFVHLAF